MGKSVFVLFLVFIGVGIIGYGEEVSVYEVVYCDDTGGEGHYTHLEEALQHVQEGGTIYLGKAIKVFSPAFISKSVKIQSLNREIYPIKIQSTDISRVFYLNDIPWFTLENVYVTGCYVDVIEGKARDILIYNSRFENCNPLYIYSRGGYNIRLEKNIVRNGQMVIQPAEGENFINLTDNQFMLDPAVRRSIIFENVHVNASQNRMDHYACIFENGPETKVQMQYNIFSGNEGKIMIKNQGENMHINRNQILKDFPEAIYYTGEGKPDFTYNWWGSKDGPGTHIDTKRLDCGYWALFEDFSRFHGDPYTLTDVRKGCKRLGEEISQDNWIYNVKEDENIDMLDIIGIIRKIN